MHSEGYRMSLVAGAVIFHEGEAGDCAYIIDKGEVGVSSAVDGKQVQFAICRHGDILGEMALIDNGVRTATATALSDTELVVIPKTYIQQLLHAADPTVDLLIKLVLDRYRQMKARFDSVSHGEVLKSVQASLSTDNPQLAEKASLAAKRFDEVQRLKNAVHEGQMELFYQPIIELKSGRIAGCESLIRWQDPERGLVLPGDFIALAEETGLIIPLGQQILLDAWQASQQCQQIMAQSEQPFFVSVNLSSRQIENEQLVNELKMFLLENDIDLTNMKVEITESVLMSDPLRVCMFLEDLKLLGAEIALDDFGTGYSSFSYLHRFPIDCIKIDRSFVSTMMNNPKSEAIVRSLCQLATSLDMKTVGEGVETVEDEAQLKSFSSDYGQGYYFSRPVPLAAFLELLQQQH